MIRRSSNASSTTTPSRSTTARPKRAPTNHAPWSSRRPSNVSATAFRAAPRVPGQLLLTSASAPSVNHFRSVAAVSPAACRPIASVKPIGIQSSPPRRRPASTSRRTQQRTCGTAPATPEAIARAGTCPLPAHCMFRPAAPSTVTVDGGTVRRSASTSSAVSPTLACRYSVSSPTSPLVARSISARSKT